MALNSANKNYFQFVKGIVTEASPLNRPENTSIDEQNFELFLQGYRKRRKGLSAEDVNQGQVSPTLASLARGSMPTMDTFRWDNPGNIADISFVLAKDGSQVVLWQEVSGKFNSYTSTYDVIDLYDYRSASATSRADIDNMRIEYTQGNGQCFIVGGLIDAISLEWDSSNSDIIIRRLTFFERDLDGLVDGSEGSSEPTSLSLNHKYNLWNQGWPDGYITQYFTAVSRYPSNAQVWFYGKRVDPSTGNEIFDSTFLQMQDFGNANAPRGRIMKNIYNHDENYVTYNIANATAVSWNNATKEFTITTQDPHGLAVSDLILMLNANLTIFNGIGYTNYDISGNWFVNAVPSTTTFTILDSSLANTATSWSFTDAGSVSVALPGSIAGTLPPYWDATNTKRYSKVEFFANRLWLAGLDDDRYGRRLYFSQIATDKVKLTRLHQDADPTSEHISDLLPTDGGFVSLPDIGNVLGMEVFGRYLLVFADNGVWAIGPGDGREFRADDYSVKELTRADLVHPRAIVKTGSNVMYWTTEGIYAVVANEVSGEPEIANLTKNTIHSLYKDVLKNNTFDVRGVFDKVENRIFWMYNDTTSELWDPTYAKNWQASKILIADLSIGAFYKYTLYEPNSTYSDFQPVALETSKEFIDNKSYVRMLVRCTIPGEPNPELLWFTFSNDQTFTDFSDFVTTGWAPPVWLDTSYEIMQDAMRKKFANYIYCYFNRTEDTAVDDGSGNFNLTVPSSCFMSVRWDWAGSAISGKYSQTQQVYRLGRFLPPGSAGSWDNGFPVVVTKNKVRGTGKSFYIHFEGEDYKDVQLLGWAIEIQGVTKV